MTTDTDTDKPTSAREALLKAAELCDTERKAWGTSAADDAEGGRTASSNCAVLIRDLAASLPQGERAEAALHACEGLDTADLKDNDRGWVAGVIHDAARVESELNYALRACCAGNTDDDEPVRCQSYEAREAPGWEPLACAPMYVYGRDALVGAWDGIGWRRVSIWEPEWTRDDIIHRGGTHWWPHLRDLPAPKAVS